MRFFLPYFLWSVSFSYFLNLVLGHVVRSDPDALVQRSVKGFTLELHYDSLLATVYFGPELGEYGNDRFHIWHNIARQIESDLRVEPYSRGGSTIRYDLWPKMTIVKGFRHPVEPSYLVRFSMVQSPSRYPQRPIDQKLLIGISEMFRFMAHIEPLPHFAFSGNITLHGEALFQFRLFDTGPSPAEREKDRDVRASDLQVINYGRQVILQQTTSKDLLIFLGSSGSYFYYAVNRPFDPTPLRRNAHLLPLSGARTWADKQPLDKIRWKPELDLFVDKLLRPIFRTLSPSRQSRAIFIDYTHQGATLLALKEMLYFKAVYLDDVYYINIESPQDPCGQPRVPHYTKLNSISIQSWQETKDLINGRLGRIVPPYPWFYWDVSPDQVKYPEKDSARALIDIIRFNRPLSSTNQSNSSIEESRPGIPIVGTSMEPIKSTKSAENNYLNRTLSSPSCRENSNTNTTNRDLYNHGDGYNNDASSIPMFPFAIIDSQLPISTSDVR